MCIRSPLVLMARQKGTKRNIDASGDGPATKMAKITALLEYDSD